MKTLVSLSIFSALFALNAQATDYPILDSYQVKAEELIPLTETAQTPEEWAVITDKTHALIQDGVEIMNLYASKNPSCTEQFAIFINEIPQMENMPLEDVHRRYHNGEGLPAAPRHCYFGRSQVVHPVMNLIRVKSAISDETRAHMVEEFDEVIEHLDKIRRNLDNPQG